MANTLHLLGQGHPTTLRSLFSLGRLLHRQSSWRHLGDATERGKRAETALVTCLTQIDHNLGTSDPLAEKVVEYLADLYLERDQFHLAEPLYRRIYKQRLAVFGNSHPGTCEAAYRLAALVEMQGRHRDAAELFRLVVQGGAGGDAQEKLNNAIKRCNMG